AHCSVGPHALFVERRADSSAQARSHRKGWLGAHGLVADPRRNSCGARPGCDAPKSTQAPRGIATLADGAHHIRPASGPRAKRILGTQGRRRRHQPNPRHTWIPATALLDSIDVATTTGQPESPAPSGSDDFGRECPTQRNLAWQCRLAVDAKRY